MTTDYSRNVKWQVLIDLDGDGVFTVPRDDVTHWFRSGQWKIGFREAYDLTASDSTFTFQLDNFHRLFSPENTDSIYHGLITTFRKVQVYCWYKDVRYGMYQGWIKEVEVSPTNTDPYVQIECMGIKSILEDQNVRIPMLVDVRSDEALIEVLQRAQTPPTMSSGTVWLIGLEDYSNIGENTVIPDLTVGYEIQTGLQTFPYIGDIVDTETTVMSMINKIVAGERGRLHYDNDNRIVFWNRKRQQTYTNLDARIDYGYVSATYLHGDLVANDIQITVYPRKISPNDNDLLWELEEPVVVRAGEIKEIEARFTDNDTSAKVSAISARIGNFASSRTIGKYLKTDSNKTTIVLDNSLEENFDATVTVITIIGQKITAYNEVEVRKINAESITRYGRRERRIDTEILSDEAFAGEIGLYELSRFKDPFGRIVDMTIRPRDANPEWLENMITLRIGDRVRVKNEITHHTSHYFIVGYTHALNDGMQDYKVTFRLEPAHNQTFWLIGTEGNSEIGETTKIGF